MKKVRSLLFLLILLILPIGVFAESDSSGEEGGGAGIVHSCSPNCVGIQRSSSLAGVRITFVDANGMAVAASGGKSYDFITTAKKSNINTTINGYEGDRNKIALAGGGNYSGTSVHQSSIPKFSAVIAAYNANILQTDSPHTSRLNTSGNTGGNLNGFADELNFFLGLTKAGNPYYVQDVNAFIKAVATVTGGYNADELIYKVAQGCSSGEEIFIVMEPVFFWSGEVGNSYQNYFGTLSDSYHFFNGEIVPSAYHLTNMAYLIYYEREIAAYHGAQGVSNKAFAIQSGTDLLSNVGYGIAVDWANDPGQYCGSCQFVDGKFSYDNKLYPGDLIIPSGFANIQHFAYTDRDEGGAGCCDILGAQLDSLPNEWKTAYDQYCKTDDECCTPKAPTIPVDININNCCTDSTVSYVKEALLDDLFCYSERLKVDYYFPKCDAEYYLEEPFLTDNKYCEMYCTERVSVEVPGAITAKSGRYFKLTETSKGTTSPYMEGFKRCRVRVFYDEWIKDYLAKVQEQVDAYNSYQKNMAASKTYENAADNEETKSGSVSITVQCKTTTQQAIPNCVGNNCTRNVDTCTDTVTSSYSYSYKKYKFTKLYDYYPVKIKESSLKENASTVEIVSDAKKTIEHATYSTYGLADAITAANAALESAKSSCECATITSATREDLPDEGAGYPEENVPEVATDYKTTAEDTDKGNFQAATGAAKDLENKIHTCDNYFTEGAGANAGDAYKFEPDLLFSYSQVYLDEYGETDLDKLDIEFDRHCNYEIIMPEEDTEGEISGPRYSGIYSPGNNPLIQVVTDFSGSGLEYRTSAGIDSSMLDTPYSADKKYTYDAKYHAVCTWTEKSKPVYTLVPSGEVSNTYLENYTIHDKEYKVYITTYDGTYQTYWDVSGIGHNGKFDPYFLDGGQTCAAENPADASMFTCKLHIKHSLVLTGKCNGTNGTDTTINKEDCDPHDDGYELFAFKVVDPKEFFPAGTTDENGNTYAHNWTSTTEGQAVMTEIETKAANDSIYAPENISYSFNLTPTAMKHIKNYNVERNADGGYTDFNMYCECPDDPETDVQTNSMENGIGCTECKSRFLENLAAGIVKYDNTEHTVNVWATNNRIQTIRDNINKW